MGLVNPKMGLGEQKNTRTRRALKIRELAYWQVVL